MKAWITPLLMGALSSLLVIVLSLLLPGPSTPGFIGFTLPGIIFGIAISILFFSFQGTRSIYRLLGFIIVAGAAYCLSVIITIFTALLLGQYGPYVSFGSAQPIEFNPLAFFVGGVVGALVLSVGLYFILGHLSVKKIIFLSLCGGVLGVLGWESASSIGYFVWFILKILEHNTTWNETLIGGAANSYSLFVVWQTGMACVISLAYQGFKRKLSDLPAS